MNGLSLLLATLALGVDYGWQHTTDGQLEYIIQIEPVAVEALNEGREIESQVHPFVRPLRRFRVRVGTEALPRPTNREPAAKSAMSAVTAVQLPQDQFGWQPIDNQQAEFIVQIPPARLAAFRRGEQLAGEVPAEAGNVTHLRIRAGTDRLPRQSLQQSTAVFDRTAAPRTGEPAPLIPAANLGQPQSAAVLASQRTGGYAPPYSGTPDLGAANPAAGTVSSTASAGSYARPNTPYATDPRYATANTGSASQPAYRGTTAAGTAPGAWWPDWTTNGQTSADPRGWNAVNSSSTTGWSAPRTDGTAPLLYPSGYTDSRDPSRTPYLQLGTGNYVAPTSGYGQPNPAYATATGGYANPNNAYPPSNSGYGQTASGYGQTASGYGQTASGYGQTTGGYGQTTNAYGQTAAGYGQTAAGYGQTAAGYGQTAAGYGQTSAGYAQPQTGPVTPAGIYNQNNAGYPPAQGTQGSQPYEAPGARVAGRDSTFRANTNPSNTDDFWKQMNQAASTRSPQMGPSGSQWDQGNRPWAPLMMTLVALFASIGANVYMGMVVARTYWRYLDLTSELGEGGRRETRPEPEDDAWRGRHERAAASV